MSEVVTTSLRHGSKAISAPEPVVLSPRRAWRDNTATDGIRVVPRETPVALTYDRNTHAVMLATPADLEDFAIGFSLSEGIIEGIVDLRALEIVQLPGGIECRMELASERLNALTRRQRRLAGPGGCGLCGLDSLAEMLRPAPEVPAGRIFTPAMVQDAMRAMPAAQLLNTATHAVHAAAFWSPDHGLMVLREDVGRHNALDKLSGALSRSGVPASGGLLLLSSRVSVEMVQKAAALGAPVMVAISAPTSLAIEVATAAGITLIGVTRADGFEVFTHLRRIDTRIARHVA
jgi:FdhD protein